MPTFPTVSLGGLTLSFPATSTNQYYRMEFVPVVGRQVTSLAGTFMNLNLIYKRRWTLTFRPGANIDTILSFIEGGSSVTFVDQDGETYSVYFVGPPSIAPFPYSALSTITITIQEE